MNQNSFSILNIFLVSWRATKRDWLFLTASSIMMVLAIILVNWSMTKITPYLNTGVALVIGIIGFLFTLLLQIGFIKISILSFDKKPRSYKELVKHFRYVAPLLITCLIIYGLVFLVMPITFDYLKKGNNIFFSILSIAPAILSVYIVIRYYFAPILIIDENLKPIPALRRSAALSKGNRLKLSLLGLSAIFLVILVFVIFGLLTPKAIVTVATSKTPNISFAILQLTISLLFPYLAMMTIASLRALQALSSHNSHNN